MEKRNGKKCASRHFFVYDVCDRWVTCLPVSSVRKLFLVLFSLTQYKTQKVSNVFNSALTSSSSSYVSRVVYSLSYHRRFWRNYILFMHILWYYVRSIFYMFSNWKFLFFFISISIVFCVVFFFLDCASRFAIDHHAHTFTYLSLK